jgi:pilus assembly protein CpaF
VIGVADDMVSLQDIFVFDRLGVSPTGKILGRFRATGVMPQFNERLKTSGITLAADLFEHTQDA